MKKAFLMILIGTVTFVLVASLFPGMLSEADVLKSGPAGFKAILLGLLNTSWTTKLTAAELPMRALLGRGWDQLAVRVFPPARKEDSDKGNSDEEE